MFFFVQLLISSTNAAMKNPRYRTIIQYLSIYALILIIVGTIGNLLTISVLTRRNLRRFSTSKYLIAVSLCDLISLYGWNLNNFYKFNISPNNRNIEDLSLFHCRFISFLTFSALQLSSWCLSAVSLGKNFRRLSVYFFMDQFFSDRALGLFWPSWKQSYGKKSYAKFYIIFLSATFAILNSHILILNGYRSESGIINCYSTRSNPKYIYPQWQRVHLVLYNLCPFIIMLICNTYIIIVTVRSSRSELNQVGNNRKNFDRYRQFTFLLIVVTFFFVVLTLPACIYFVFFRNTKLFQTEREYRFLVQIFLNSIQFTSHGINFFLYCFTAKSFRHEIREMCHDALDNTKRFFRQSSLDSSREIERLAMSEKRKPKATERELLPIEPSPLHFQNRLTASNCPTTNLLEKRL